MPASKLDREFYTRSNTLLIARELLGKRLVVPAEDGARVSGMIVETEAYMGPQDKASHAFGGRRTKRNEILYGPGGAAYVFFVYGMYYQLNVVVNVDAVPHCVLIRALEPEEGTEWMERRRSTVTPRNLTSGPGKLCQALAIDRGFNGEDLRGGRLWLEETERRVRPNEIAKGVRIGIDYAEEYALKPWRFWLKESPHVSKRPNSRNPNRL
jgi:DNA-3-methyladenine glycosylase